MITISDLLSIDRILCNVDAGSKKRVLELLGELLAGAQVPSDEESEALSEAEIFDTLLNRERLGSTGLGHGVAIPHARIKGGTTTCAAFIKLADGIDFDAVDQQPVDLLFALLVPETCTDEHLQLLAQLSRMFSDPQQLQQLRTSDSRQQLLTLLQQWQPPAT